ncbi:adenylate kinase isoenzyme 5-like [Acomys russatus]|uniref:adenylate kinase isoenzyme 5-like n=1 Tax=Acomys russatus TaxID=60746 RepID=UPI0021E2FC7E|nr:adenylate kinase isoenzyme 5-like [Acomys russatus]
MAALTPERHNRAVRARCISDSAQLCVSCCKLVCPCFPQCDADRDEDAVFCDISVAVDNKLFPNKEARTDSSDLDPSMLFDAGDIVDTGSDYDNQGDDQLNLFGEETAGGSMEDFEEV